MGRGPWGHQGAGPADGPGGSRAVRVRPLLRDGTQKWEVGEFIEVLGTASTRTAKVEVDQSGRELFENQCDEPDALNALVTLGPDEFVAKVEASVPKERRKVTVTAQKTKAVNRYFVVASEDGWRLPKWEEGYATQAEARAAMKARLRAFKPTAPRRAPWRSSR